jgi:hypothetical protein
MKSTNWTAVAIVGIVALLILMFGASVIGGRGYNNYGYGAWGMVGPWMMGGMFFMWLIPVGVVVLAVLGVGWLVRSMVGGMNPPPSSRSCPSCGRPVMVDWHHCAHCGNALTR